jgi:hypothetical protein
LCRCYGSRDEQGDKQYFQCFLQNVLILIKR